jgi:hypothetical protein
LLFAGSASIFNGAFVNAASNHTQSNLASGGEVLMHDLHYPCGNNGKVKPTMASTLLLRLVLGGAAIACTLLLVGGVDAKKTGAAAEMNAFLAGGKDVGVPKFWLPKKVGDVREVTFTNNMYDKFDNNIGGTKSAPSNTTLQVFQGKIKTLAVDDDGRETLAEISVDSCKDTFNGNTVTLLAAGTVMLAKAKANKIEVSYKDGDLYNDTIGEPFLRMAVNMPVREQLPDDIMRVFGTKNAKKVGDTWSGDKELLVSWINKTRTDKLPPEAITGSAKVVALVKDGGVSYVDLEVTIATTFKDFNETVYNKKPAKLKVNGEIKTTYTFRFPADFSTGPVKSGWKNNVSQRHEGTIEGENATVQSDIRDSWTETAKYSSAGKK